MDVSLAGIREALDGLVREDTTPEQVEQRVALSLALGTLPPHYAQALLLRAAGYSHREIAERLQVGADMVLQRAERLLVAQLRKDARDR